MFLFFLLIAVAAIASIPLIFDLVENKRNRKEFDESFYKTATGSTYDDVKKDDGRYGEYLTWREIKNYDVEGSKFLFNVILNKINGKGTTEIDLMMIDKYGVFVIENKNYSGWIFGSDYSTYWTQSLQAGRKSHKEQFFNPILQNEVHIKNLKQFLGEIPIYSIIVFANKSSFMKLTLESTQAYVIHQSELFNTIKDIRSKTVPVLSQDQLNELFNSFMNKKSTPAEQQEHAERIHNAYQSTEICPWCGGKLVLRNGKYGEFYGCSNYPKCRYIKKS